MKINLHNKYHHHKYHHHHKYLHLSGFPTISLGYEDPTNPTFEATTAMYHQTCENIIHEMVGRGEGQLEVMFATHNEDTLRHLFKR